MAKRKMTAALILAYFDYGQDLSQDSIWIRNDDAYIVGEMYTL